MLRLKSHFYIYEERNLPYSTPLELRLIHKVSFPPYISEEVVQLYERKPNVIRSFGLRVAPLLESANIQKDKIEEHFVSEIPLWCIRKPEVNLTLHTGKKSDSNPHLLKESLHQLQSQFIDYQCIYTDGF